MTESEKGNKKRRCVTRGGKGLNSSVLLFSSDRQIEQRDDAKRARDEVAFFVIIDKPPHCPARRGEKKSVFNVFVRGDLTTCLSSHTHTHQQMECSFERRHQNQLILSFGMGQRLQRRGFSVFAFWGFGSQNKELISMKERKKKGNQTKARNKQTDHNNAVNDQKKKTNAIKVKKNLHSASHSKSLV